MRRANLTQRILLVLTLVATGATSFAEQVDSASADIASADSDSIWTRDTLTGDWGGYRPNMEDDGLDIGLRLSQYYQDVTSGGIDSSNNGEYGGTMDYRVGIDANKLFGSWQGLTFNMHVRTRHGEDVNADTGSLALQNVGMLMPAPGNYSNTDLTGLTVTQAFSVSDVPVMVTVGLIDVVDTVTGLFPNFAYGQEGFWNINSTVSAMPWFGAVRGLALYGAMGLTINTEHKMLQSAIFALGTENESANINSVSDAFDEGVWLAAFHRFFWKADDKTGYFMVFAGTSTREQASNDRLDFINIPGQGIESTKEKKPWDIALYLYQDVWQAPGNSNRKVTIFTGGTIGPDNPQFSNRNFFANVEAFGLMDSRPNDRMGVGGWWNSLSGDFKALVEPVVEVRNTWGFEVYYNIELNKWLHLTPDLQWIQNERVGDSRAVVPGIRLVADF